MATENQKNTSGSNTKKEKYKERYTFDLREKVRSVVSLARRMFYVPCSKFGDHNILKVFKEV